MTKEMYRQLGISDAVHDFGREILDGLTERFAQIDEVAEYNQCKVIAAMQKNRVNATHFAATTGYGYDDEGRDNLERVYADCFHTEAALVRPQITCGTHALTVALSANLLVTEDTCPSFVWNTCDDELVLAINSIEYVEALQAHHVPCEYHMFISGPHGLSLADETVAVNDGFINPEVARWFGLCRAWLRKIDFVVKR